MANGPSILSRIGSGAISFASGRSQAEIDTIRANRDVSEQQVEIAENTATLQTQEIEASEAATLKAQQVQGLIATVQAGGEDSQEAANLLFQLEPQMADDLFKNMGATSADQREDASRRSVELLSIPFGEKRDAAILEQVAELRSQGRNADDTESLIGQSPEEQDAALKLVQGAALSTKERAAQAITQEQLALSERGVVVQEGKLTADTLAAKVLASFKVEERDTKEIQQNLKTEEGLRKEVNTLLKDFFQVADANARIVAAGKDSSPAGDLALIFNFMKMLDPGSTVREGEFATAEQSAGLPTRMVGLYNKIVTGERLPQKQRDDFLDRAVALFEAAQQEAGKTAASYEQIATSAGVNVGNVLATFQQRAVAGPGGEQPAPEAGEENVVKFDAQGNRI